MPKVGKCLKLEKNPLILGTLKLVNFSLGILGTLKLTNFFLGTLGISLVCYASSVPASVNPVRKNFSNGVKEGNSLYRQGKYDGALKYYNEAGVDMPDSDVVSFNKGTAFYQKRDYQKAIEAFNKALLSDNPRIEEKAAYNIGNSKYRSGKLKENTDLSSAVNFYRQALDYYKRAIELNQNDTDAKYNHEFVEKELKILLDKLKQQSSSAKASKNKQKRKNSQQKQQSSSAKASEDKQKQAQQDSQQKEKKEQEQQQAQVSASEQEEKKQEEKQQAAQGDKEKKGGQKKQVQEQAKSYEPEQKAQKEMSKEEAEMILDRYNQKERSFGNMDRNTGDRHYPRVLKDW